ncbi:hypothetical protein A2Y85_08775 [candidate division WOR-3 bacterium RBG_13_43_14]|uniref:FlgD Ig-like domain-containing protein n=1 Tax=candidate division WOR-3 bacterium RBG_13_43_14 TaxID=1802590 RepID=A0A1F4U2V2_UNCW3|nr:MAG: hypothetical protein A2Y85_08775 [candidate division WOR-3 bacterium RBG_13_43_14]
MKIERQLPILLIIQLHTVFILLNSISIVFAYPPGWSDDILINNDTLWHHDDPDITTDNDNNVWITWDDATWTSGEIYFSKRDSLGNCLIPPTNLSNNTSVSKMSKIAVDRSNNIQFIWRDLSPSGYGVWHAKLASDGSVLVPSHLAVSGGGGFFSTLHPAMTINKYNEIYVIWDEINSLGNNQMCFSKLDSMGMPVVEKIPISPESLAAFWPGIGVDSFANCHLGYRIDSIGGPYSDRLTYSKVDINGNILISNKVFSYGSSPTMIADQQQNIHVLYTNTNGSGTRIEHLKIDQQGNVLSGPDTIKPQTYAYYSNGHMAMDSLHYFHIVWTAAYVGAPGPGMYAKMDTMANIIIPPTEIIYPDYILRPDGLRIATDHRNRLHVTWLDQRRNPGYIGDIYYKRGENEQQIYEINHTFSPNTQSIIAAPNPFSHVLTIKLSNAGVKIKQDLEIFNAAGRKVYNTSFIPHNKCIYWDGRDNEGGILPAGVYFINIENNMGGAKCMVIKLK